MAFRRGGAGKRRDAAEPAIVDALRDLGCTVRYLSGVGNPDLLVRYRGRWTPLEVKTGKGTRTQAQVEAGAGDSWPIVRTPDEAMRAIGFPASPEPWLTGSDER